MPHDRYLEMEWNGYPKHIRESLLNRLKSNPQINSETEADVTKIYIRLPFVGVKSEQLVKSLIRKMKRFLKPNVKFIVSYNTKKVAYFCSTKDPVHDYQRHNIVYRLTCPGCGEKYIGKTDCCLLTRLTQHGNKADQPMYNHFAKCDHFKELYAFLNIESSVIINSPSSEFQINALLNNYEIVTTNSNWSQLIFLEALRIKKERPAINIGLRFSRELVLFN